jgi:hypothetical protein
MDDGAPDCEMKSSSKRSPSSGDPPIEWRETREGLGDIRSRAYSASLKRESQRIEQHIDQRYWLLRKTIEHWWTALLSPVERAPLASADQDACGRASGQPAAPVSDGTTADPASPRNLMSPPFPELVFDLAVVDLFVEKAQDKLTERADRNAFAGTACIVAAMLLLGLTAVLLLLRRKWARLFDFVAADEVQISPRAPDLATAGTTVVASSPWAATVENVLLTSAVVGTLFGMVYLFIMLARAMLHEATILRNRRHSVRLARLLMYLKLTSASTPHELRELKRSLDSAQMEAIFGWNLQSSTAFKDIRGEAATNSLLGQVLQTVQRGFEAFGRKPS